MCWTTRCALNSRGESLLALLMTVPLVCRQVCTPCYRAPEVVIARGKYSSAMDLWSVGCIFGELLQRMERSGSSFTPKLTIEPVFKLSPNTPKTPSMTTTFQEDHGFARRVRCCQGQSGSKYCAGYLARVSTHVARR